MIDAVTKSFKRDPGSQILINSDEKSYREHMFRTEVMKEIFELRDQISFIKNELINIKHKLSTMEEKV